jgi:hypothetical protein
MTTITGKSVILDIADNYGDSGYTGIRQVDFYLSGVKITVTSGFTAYASSYYSGGPPDKAFNTSTSKTGDYWNQGFLSNSSTNIRLICVFDSAIDFDEIKINNHHYYGGELTRGSKNVKIHSSTDTIISTVYNEAIENSTLLFEGIFDQHSALDDEDEQTIVLSLSSIEIEDISLDLSAYYQTRDNLAAILSATDGTAFQDLEAILKIYGQSIENMPAELAAYYQDRHDITTILKMFATGYKDLPTALQAMGLGRADLPAQLKALAWASRDLNTILAAVTPLVFKDFGLSLSATDGTTINDLSTVLAAVKRAPQYRSVVAQRVRSVISEVI